MWSSVPVTYWVEVSSFSHVTVLVDAVKDLFVGIGSALQDIVARGIDSDRDNAISVMVSILLLVFLIWLFRYKDPVPTLVHRM